MDLKSMTLQEMQEYMESIGEKKFRAKQIYEWFHKHLALSLDEMNNVPKKLKEKIEQGMPVLATCAGLILLAEELSNDDKRHFATLPVCVKRNAYGRQLGSFHYDGEIKGLGVYPMEFIRAPYIESVKPGVEVLAEVDGHIVAVKYQNQIALAFHPELSDDTRIHQMFLGMIK